MAYNPANSPSVARYNKKTYKQISLFLKKAEDADVLAKLEEVPNKKDYICSLIRQDLKRK